MFPGGLTERTNSWRFVYLPALAALSITLGLSFAASTYFTNELQSAVLGSTTQIATTSMPGVVHLSELRAHLRVLERQMARGAEGAPLDGAAVDLALAGVRAERDAYRDLPHPSAAAQTAWNEAFRSLRAFEGTVYALRTQAASEGRPIDAKAYIDARAEANTTFDRLRNVVETDAREARLAASRIERSAIWFTRASYSIAALSLLASLTVIAVGGRVIRRQLRAEEERTRELEEFANRVAHDIRGPLSPILLALETGASSASDPKIKRAMENAIRGVHRISDIIASLYDFARAGAKSASGARCDVAPTLHEVVEDIRSATATPIELHAADCAVACSRGALASIVSNLVNNAVKYGSTATGPQIEVRASSGVPFVVIEVEDNGIGVAPELREKVFEPYVRASSSTGDGLGLGLATVKRLVEAHGGTVGVRVGAKGGSTFWVQLPAIVPPVVGSSMHSRAVDDKRR